MNSGMTSSILMIVAMFALMYFLMIRPEKKRKQQAENMRNALKKGDSIVTIGGIMGKVVSVTDETFVIETSEDRVRIEFVKDAVSSNETANARAAEEAKKAEEAKAKAKAAKKADK